MTVLPSPGATILGLNAVVISASPSPLGCGDGFKAGREGDPETADPEPDQHRPRPGEIGDPLGGQPLELGEPRLVAGTAVASGAGEDPGVGPDLGPCLG